MLSPPDELSSRTLASTLLRGWDLPGDSLPVDSLPAGSLTYRPVGFGSHHWELTDPRGGRWFVTVDDLRTRQHSHQEPLDAAYARLRASLTAAAELRRQGQAAVVAPVPTSTGEPVLRAGDHFAVALYPYVDGQSFSWGEFPTPEHRWAVLDILVAVHTADRVVRRHALADDFTVPHRDQLSAGLREADRQRGGDADREICHRGPYAGPTADLLATGAAPVRGVLAHYDELVAAAGAHRSRAVLTHGEPHPGNTMRTPDGWRLIDWDTALVAPPERDLWMLDRDGSMLDARSWRTSPADRLAG